MQSFSDEYRRRVSHLPGHTSMIESGKTSGTWSFLGETSRWFYLRGKRTCRVVTWKVKYELVSSPNPAVSCVGITVDCVVSTQKHQGEKFESTRIVPDILDVNFSRIAARMIKELATGAVLTSRARPTHRKDVSVKPSVLESLAALAAAR